MKLDLIKRKGIYHIKHNDQIIYIGSTNNFFERVGQHCKYIDNPSSAKEQYEMYLYLSEIKNEISIELFYTEDDYRKKEKEIIFELKPLLNKHNIVMKEHNRKEYSKIYYRNNKDKINSYNSRQRDYLNKKQISWRERNKEKIEEYNLRSKDRKREWYLKNREIILEKRKLSKVNL